jgi:hypothetical protein
MTGGSLDTCLCGIRKQPTRNSKEDLSTNDAAIGFSSATIVYHETKGNHEKNGAGQNKGLEPAYPIDDQADRNPCQRRTETVKYSDAIGRLLRLIEGDSDDREQEIALTSPGSRDVSLVLSA